MKKTFQNLKKSAAFRFCLTATHSPTYYNLSHYLQNSGWRKTAFKWLADFSEQNFQFYQPAAECLEFKNLLAQLVTQYCPQLMPVSYCINDYNWSLVLSQIAEAYYQQANHSPDLAWILKPALLNNGQHIKIFQSLSQLEQHFLSSNRLGGEHVLQRYVIHPHLLKGPLQGHKYSIRMFVVLTNYAGAYLYPKGYFNIGLHPYNPNDFSDLRLHLTNEHLNDEELNVVQVPTEQYALFKPFYPKIKQMVSLVIGGLQKSYPQAFTKEKPPTLAIFGFDFMVDAEEQLYLLEANHAPCFPVNEDHPLQQPLYYDFWQAIISNFIEPIATNQLNSHQYQVFESLTQSI